MVLHLVRVDERGVFSQQVRNQLLDVKILCQCRDMDGEEWMSPGNKETKIVQKLKVIRNKSNSRSTDQMRSSSCNLLSYNLPPLQTLPA